MQTDFFHSHSVSSDAFRLDLACTRTAAAAAPTGAGLDDVLSAATGYLFSAVRAVGRWYESRAVARELDALDDRSLKDIGLYRGDIAYVAELAAVGLDPRPVPSTPARPSNVAVLPAARPAVPTARLAA